MVVVNADLIEKVILYKNRVWTIYSYMQNPGHESVFAYQGLKPFSSFNYREDSDRFSSFKRNIVAVNSDEIVLLEGEELQKAIKKEKSLDKKELTQKKAVEFYHYLTGHSKSLINKSIKHHAMNSYSFGVGAITYDLWKVRRGYAGQPYLILSHNMGASTKHLYFDYLTFETDDVQSDRSWEEVKEEIIENYKEWKGCKC